MFIWRDSRNIETWPPYCTEKMMPSMGESRKREEQKERQRQRDKEIEPPSIYQRNKRSWGQKSGQISVVTSELFLCEHSSS